MKTLSPHCYHLTRRPNAAEHYFAPVNFAPGDAARRCCCIQVMLFIPITAFDIPVADPVTTLTTRAQKPRYVLRARLPSLSTIRYTFCDQPEALPFSSQL